MSNQKISLPPYVAFYGMDRDPFSEQKEDDLFYTEPSREQRIGTLLHLTQFGNELMMVTGPKGCGKRTLLQQFKIRSPETWKIAHIDAQDGVDERKLIQQMYRQMDLKFRGATHGELLEQMKTHFELLQRNSQYCVLLINNAELLPVTAMDKVLEMASLTSSVNKPLLRIVLFGTATLANKFDEPLLAKYTNLPRRTLELSPFSEEQTAHYILYRLSAAHFVNNDLFTPSVLLKLYTDSYGWPERINELARNILANSLPKNNQTSSTPFSATTFQSSRLIALVLMIAIVAALLVFQDNITQWADQLTARNNANTGSSLEATPKPVTIASTAKPPSPENKPTDSLVETLKQRNPAYGSIASTTATASATVPTQKPVTAAVTKQAMSPPKPRTDSFELSSIPNKENWILDQNSSYFTLQVVAGKNLKTIEDFITEHKLHNNIAFYRSARKDKPWYGLIYGLYPHKQAAISAINQMPAKLQRLKPWVRSIEGVKKDINRTRPQTQKP